MRPYVIRAGDTLSRLAARRGFDAEEVWQHADNEALRNARPHRDMLASGDVVRIPDGTLHDLDRGTTNTFSARRGEVAVTLTLEGADGALANKSFQVVHRGAPEPDLAGQTDDQGQVSLTLPIEWDEVELVIAECGLRLPVAVGYLDPVEVRSGVVHRLEHLGYLRHGTVRETGNDAGSEERLRAAVARFQRDHDQEATGSIDDALRAALRDRHGC